MQIRNKKKFYKVKWAGYDETTWEPYINVKDISFDFEEFDNYIYNKKYARRSKINRKISSNHYSTTNQTVSSNSPDSSHPLSGSSSEIQIMLP